MSTCFAYALFHYVENLNSRGSIARQLVGKALQRARRDPAKLCGFSQRELTISRRA